jgi:hypothetical protein
MKYKLRYWLAAIALLLLGIAGCSKLGNTPAAVSPVAMTTAATSPTFSPYATLPPLPPAPPNAAQHPVHRQLRVVERDKKTYLVDNSGHSYLAARDTDNHLYPAFRDPSSGHLFPLYYDKARDNYYRLIRTDSGRFGRNYIGTPATQYYADPAPITGYPTDPGWYAPPPEPLAGPVPVSYRDYYPPTTCYRPADTYYGADEYYPPSWAPYPPGGYCPPRGYYADPDYAPVIVEGARPRHHSNDWLWAIPVLIGAYLLLHPHHHHDYPCPPVPPYAIHGGYYRQRRWVPVEAHPWGYRQTNFVNSRQYNVTNIYERTTINNYYGSNPRRTPHVVLASIQPARPSASPLYRPFNRTRFAQHRQLQASNRPQPVTAAAPSRNLIVPANQPNRPPHPMTPPNRHPNPAPGHRPPPVLISGSGKLAPRHPHANRPSAATLRPGTPQRPVVQPLRQVAHHQQPPRRLTPPPVRARVQAASPPTRPRPGHRLTKPVRRIAPRPTVSRRPSPPQAMRPRVKAGTPRPARLQKSVPSPRVIRAPQPVLPRRQRPIIVPPPAQRPVPQPRPQWPRRPLPAQPTGPMNSQANPRPGRALALQPRIERPNVPPAVQPRIERERPSAPPVMRQPRIQTPSAPPVIRQPRIRQDQPRLQLNQPPIPRTVPQPRRMVSQAEPRMRSNNNPRPPGSGPEPGQRRGQHRNGEP